MGIKRYFFRHGAGRTPSTSAHRDAGVVSEDGLDQKRKWPPDFGMSALPPKSRRPGTARLTRLELVINLETAKALDLDLPAKILALADAVVE
jgi:hypothetical protein